MMAVVAGAKVALQFSLPHESVLDFFVKAFEIAFVSGNKVHKTQAKPSEAQATLVVMRSR